MGDDGRRPVYVSGIGAVTPYGIGVEPLREGFLHGRSAVRPIASFDASTLPVRIAAEVPEIDLSEHFESKDHALLTRLSAYTVLASRMALEDGGIEEVDDPGRFGVFLGTGFGSLAESGNHFIDYEKRGDRSTRPTTIPLLMLNAPSAQVAMRLGLQGPTLTLSTACSSGSHAIGQALCEIREGRADRMLAGGGEIALTRPIFVSWCRMRVLARNNEAPEQASRPFDLGRDGLVAADAVLMLLLESEEALRRRGGVAIAEVAGYAANEDASHITAPSLPTEVAAMRLALRDAGIDAGEVDYLSAHGTATKLNDRTEAEAIREVFGGANGGLRVSSVKSMIGHTMGASGAIGAAASLFAIQDGRIPPTINLTDPDPECRLQHVANVAERRPTGTAMVNSFGFGGHNAVLILRRAEDR